MQRSFEAKVLELWGQITRWMKRHRRIVRLISLMSGLALFLLFVPATVRFVFWFGLRSHPILASMLVVFALLGISLVWSEGQLVDAWMFLLFNVRGKRPIWLDWIMSGLTQLGNGFTVLGIGLILYLFGDRLLAYELVLGTLTLWLVVELVKYLVQRVRPYLLLAQARVVGFRPIGTSFPSGHTSQAFFMASMITQHYHINVWVAFLFYSGAAVVGITRMYVGAHYPRDVLAGAILGSAWGLLGVILDGYVMNR